MSKSVREREREGERERERGQSKGGREQGGREGGKEKDRITRPGCFKLHYSLQRTTMIKRSTGITFDDYREMDINACTHAADASAQSHITPFRSQTWPEISHQRTPS